MSISFELSDEHLDVLYCWLDRESGESGEPLCLGAVYLVDGEPWIETPPTSVSIPLSLSELKEVCIALVQNKHRIPPMRPASL